MMLVISIVMGIVPLLGIAWTIATGTVTTVDGLFMSLILLTLSAVFFSECFLGAARSWSSRLSQQKESARCGNARSNVQSDDYCNDPSNN